MDKGPWSVMENKSGVFVESDDFTHDASLKVEGDFKDYEQHLDYARFIAATLNASRSS